MSDETTEENQVEVEGEHYIKVSMDHYNSIIAAADLGYEVMVERQNMLKTIEEQVPHYPERDSSKMKQPKKGLLDGVPLNRHDLGDLIRNHSARIAALAEALNHRLHNKRYK